MINIYTCPVYTGIFALSIGEQDKNVMNLFKKIQGAMFVSHHSVQELIEKSSIIYYL